jgi:hypothetical protein
MPAGSTNSSVDALWAEHAAAVRRQLLEHGVPPTDLDDVVQEVFMRTTSATSSRRCNTLKPGCARSRAVLRLGIVVGLHHALGRLDGESRDLVALRELGSLPLTEVAALVKADRTSPARPTPRRSDRPDRHGRHRSVARPADAGGSAAARREPAARRGHARLQGWLPGGRRLRAARPNAGERGRR